MGEAGNTKGMVEDWLCARVVCERVVCGKVVCVTERECVCACVSVKSVACDNVVCVYGRVVCVKEACVCM